MSDEQSNPEEATADHGVGSLLRASRLRVGEELADVARMLCIRRPYLEAIEDGRYEDLPGTTYAAGFVRSYSEHLGLDSDEVVRRFKAETSGKQAATRLDFPVPVHESGVPNGALLFVGLLIAAVAYGVWFVSTSEDNPFADKVSPVPEEIAEEKPVAEPEPAMQKAEEMQAVEAIDDDAAQVPAEDAGEQAVVDSDGVAEVVELAEEATGTDEANEQAVATEDVNEQDVAATAQVTAQEQNAEQNAETEASAISENQIEAAEEASVTEAADVASEATDEVIESVTDEASATDDVAEAAPEEQRLAEQADTSVSEENTENVSETAPEQAPEPIATSVPETETEPQVAEVSGDTGTVYGQENADARIIVRAIADSYIQVRDEDAGEVLIARLLVKGDSYLVPNRSGLKLLAGNAGGIQILVDGKEAPSIGSTGDVRRGVALDASRLQDGSAVEQ